MKVTRFIINLQDPDFTELEKFLTENVADVIKTSELLAEGEWQLVVVVYTATRAWKIPGVLQ